MQAENTITIAARDAGQIEEMEKKETRRARIMAACEDGYILLRDGAPEDEVLAMLRSSIGNILGVAR